MWIWQKKTCPTLNAVAPAQDSGAIRVGSAAPAPYPPFLFWPVVRSGFYRAIILALILPLLWGIVIFGLAAMTILAALLAGMCVSYWLLKSWTRRGKLMEFTHTLCCTLIVGAMTAPTMSVTLMLGVGLLIPVLICLLGLPGRESVHVALLLPLFFLVLAPQPPRWPLLARNRLIFGNIHQAVSIRRYDWPRSDQIHGADAVRLLRPSDAIGILYKHIGAQPTAHKTNLAIRQTFSFGLPTPKNLMLGAVPGWIGTGSILAIVLAGLFLSWRHVLLPTPCATFLLSVLAGLLFGPLSPHQLHHQFWQSLGGIWFLRPEEALSLLAYELLSSDFLFAAVFVLALPGTMPMEPLPRSIFLLIAGLGAALAHRLMLPVPPATFAILAMQPLAPAFDAIFHRRSWLVTALRPT